MRSFLKAGLLSAALAFGALATTAALAEDAPKAAARAKVSDFDLKTLDGGEVKLSELKGKVVVVSFWATWCGPCKQELPYLDEFYQAHKDDGLVVLAISTDGPDTLSQVRSLVRRKRWTMPILLDSDGSVQQVLNPRGTQPYTLFIDRQGQVAETHEGFSVGDQDGYLTTIKKLLAEKP